MRQYFVYILASHARRLYVGVTGNLTRRMHEHRCGTNPSFTHDFHITRLVYFAHTANVSAAITREKQLKRWTRERKIRLIEASNAGWRDLSVDVIPHERSECRDLPSHVWK